MKKITIAVIVFASLAGVGLLGNLITLDVQPFGIFASLTELEGSTCSCKGDDGSFSPANCEGFTGEYTDTNGVCSGLTSLTSYGIPASDSQGCSASFWIANADNESVWPSGYSPDFYYNSMFQTTIELSELAQTDTDTNDEGEQSSQVFGTSEITSDGELSEDVETVDENADSEDVETVDESVDSEDVEAVDESIETEDVETVDENAETVDESVDSEDVETVDESVETSENQIGEDPLFENEALTADQDINGLTLAQALNLKDGNLAALLSESVAAMLNAAHPDVNYPYAVSEIMSMTQIAIASGDYDGTINLLKKINDKNSSPLCRASYIEVLP